MLNFSTLLAKDDRLLMLPRLFAPAVPRQQDRGTPSLRRVTVAGAGAWGTALAIAFARAGIEVRLWGRSAEKVRQMAAAGRNLDALPDTEFPDGLEAVSDLETAAAESDAVFLAVPSSAIRETAARISAHIADNTPVVSCAKGLDPETGDLLTDVIAAEIPNAAPMVLSGPSFASEVADGHPTTVVVAGMDALTKEIAEQLSSNGFLITQNEDVIGVQVAGVMKNVIAVACGIADGLGSGSNTRAGILARGLEEAAELAARLGGDKTTLLGAAGAGDLALTCTDPQSRNYSLGYKIATGDEASGSTFEGAANAERVLALSEKLGLEAPVTRVVVAVLKAECSPDQLITRLFAVPETAKANHVAI